MAGGTMQNSQYSSQTAVGEDKQGTSTSSAYTGYVGFLFPNVNDWIGSAPDLVISDIAWSDENPHYVGDELSLDVTIKNIGNVTLESYFYVDLYYHRDNPPSVGFPGDDYLFVEMDIPVGDSIVVTFQPISSSSITTWQSYVQIDMDGFVAEQNEENNVFGPETVVWQNLPIVQDVSIQNNSGNIELHWSYPISVDRFRVYRGTTPEIETNFPYAVINGALTSWSDPTPEDGNQYFYVVTAFRYEDSKIQDTKSSEERKRRLKNKNE
jgi:hypothetical protein